MTHQWLTWRAYMIIYNMDQERAFYSLACDATSGRHLKKFGYEYNYIIFALCLK